MCAVCTRSSQRSHTLRGTSNIVSVHARFLLVTSPIPSNFSAHHVPLKFYNHNNNYPLLGDFFDLFHYAHKYGYYNNQFREFHAATTALRITGSLITSISTTFIHKKYCVHAPSRSISTRKTFAVHQCDTSRARLSHLIPNYIVAHRCSCGPLLPRIHRAVRRGHILISLGCYLNLIYI